MCADVPPAASVFDASAATSWLLTGIVGCCMDLFLFNLAGVVSRAWAEFITLLIAGTDGSTLARRVGNALVCCSVVSAFQCN